MDKKKIQRFLENRGMDPKERLGRKNGGQYLDNFLVEFSEIIREETIREVSTTIKEAFKDISSRPSI